MNEPEFFFCYITCPDLETAKKLGNMAVTERLAACANILPGIISIYTWNDKLENATEVVLILKTTAICLKELEQVIIAHHPYECPCFVTLPVISGNENYLDWLRSNTQSKPG